MNKHVVSIDQGTTSTRAIVFDHAGLPVGSGQLEHRQIFPNAGWVEHDAVEIWKNTRQVIGLALGNANLTRHDVVAVGITNQRETAVVWDRTTGKAVHNAIVWQDTRTDQICNRLMDDGGLTLVGDADRDHVVSGEVRVAEGEADHLARVLSDLDGVVLDPARVREDLAVFELAGADGQPGVVEHDRAGGRRALVDGDDVVGHDSLRTASAVISATERWPERPSTRSNSAMTLRSTASAPAAPAIARP